MGRSAVAAVVEVLDVETQLFARHRYLGIGHVVEPTWDRLEGGSEVHRVVLEGSRYLDPLRMTDDGEHDADGPSPLRPAQRSNPDGASASRKRRRRRRSMRLWRWRWPVSRSSMSPRGNRCRSTPFDRRSVRDRPAPRDDGEYEPRGTELAQLLVQTGGEIAGEAKSPPYFGSFRSVHQGSR
jgi:hypothetical protein